MRILANYGYKTNGETYSVTFETTGDVQRGKEEETVDELFRLAKEAIQRQLALGSVKEEEIGISEENNNDSQTQTNLPTNKQVSFFKQLARELGWTEEQIENTQQSITTKSKMSNMIEELKIAKRERSKNPEARNPFRI